MFQVTCPFCYRRINWLRLPFVCTGQNAPGKTACQRAVNPRRRSETLSDETMYPVFPPPRRWGPSPRRAHCPDCGGRTGQHACPACHTPLPADFGGGSPVIGLIGARNTGKTVYLTVLANHLQTVLRDRFRADVSLYGDAARGWMETNVHAILDLGTLPALTQQPTGRSEPLVFQWRRLSRRYPRRYRNSYLYFLDTAGESLGTHSGVAELKFLTSVNAFIVMLDPFTLPVAAERLALPESAPSAAADPLGVLSQVTDALRNAEGVWRGGKCTLPMAVVFAKIDTFQAYLGGDHSIFAAGEEHPWHDDAVGRAVHDSVRELLWDWKASAVDIHMESHYSNFRYFALSALGRPPDYKNRLVAKGGVRPLHVDDPLVWLLSQYRLVPRRRGVR
jgi:hypothetical protein